MAAKDRQDVETAAQRETLQVRSLSCHPMLWIRDILIRIWSRGPVQKQKIILKKVFLLITF
jgi:hypothetical protein